MGNTRNIYEVQLMSKTAILTRHSIYTKYPCRFYNKLNEYHTYEFPQIITELIPVSNNYDWTGYDKWGVSEEAFQAIKESKLSPIKVFSHPRLLREHPILTGYYRNVSVLSQKAVSYLVNIHPLRFENDNEIDMGEGNALVLSRLFNEHVSLIIENVLGILVKKISMDYLHQPELRLMVLGEMRLEKNQKE